MDTVIANKYSDTLSTLNIEVSKKLLLPDKNHI